ncbi:MAG TPA: hypothetical protein PLL14_11325 [Accumulibacter sp.]|nr:hypothetical protein [Accumulibacter sp.]
MDTMKLRVRFGAMCEGIDEQVRQQGFMLPDKDRGTFQKCADAATLLSVQGYATDAETVKIRKRIMKAIGKAAVAS